MRDTRTIPDPPEAPPPQPPDDHLAHHLEPEGVAGIARRAYTMGTSYPQPVDNSPNHPPLAGRRPTAKCEHFTYEERPALTRYGLGTTPRLRSSMAILQNGIKLRESRRIIGCRPPAKSPILGQRGGRFEATHRKNSFFGDGCGPQRTFRTGIDAARACQEAASPRTFRHILVTRSLAENWSVVRGAC